MKEKKGDFVKERRIFKRAIILLILSASLLIFSCSQDSPEQNNNVSTANGVPEQETEEEILYELDLPAVDMGGKVFRIVTTGWYGHEPLNTVDITTEELTGEPINDAAYNRQIYIEHKYNVTLREIYFPDFNNAARSIQTHSQAGADEYDLCLIRSMNFSQLVTSRSIMDLKDIPTIDVTKPWWEENSYREFSLLNRHYGLCGDITTNHYLAVWCIFFNKDMIRDYGLDNPYNLVESGEWTFDKVFEMAAVVNEDLNGDGIMNVHDRFGIGHLNDSAVSMISSVGVRFGEIDNNGIPVFTLGREENITKMLKVFERLFDREQVYNHHSRGEGEFTMFANGQILFEFTATNLGYWFRGIDVDFGILPYPKLDKSQLEYITTASPLFLTLATVPVTNTDFENTGILMEEMAYQGYKNIKPAFYDGLLQRKIARDEESGAMFDYLYENITYDAFATLNISNFTFDFITTIPNNNDLNIVSFIERREGRIQSGIEALLNAV